MLMTVLHKELFLLWCWFVTVIDDAHGEWLTANTLPTSSLPVHCCTQCVHV